MENYHQPDVLTESWALSEPGSRGFTHHVTLSTTVNCNTHSMIPVECVHIWRLPHLHKTDRGRLGGDRVITFVVNKILIDGTVFENVSDLASSHHVLPITLGEVCACTEKVVVRSAGGFTQRANLGGATGGGGDLTLTWMRLTSGKDILWGWWEKFWGVPARITRASLADRTSLSSESSAWEISGFILANVLECSSVP